MTRITPLPLDRVSAELREAVELQETLLGLVPESLLTMAHQAANGRHLCGARL